MWIVGNVPTTIAMPVYRSVVPLRREVREGPVEARRGFQRPRRAGSELSPSAKFHPVSVRFSRRAAADVALVSWHVAQITLGSPPPTSLAGCRQRCTRLIRLPHRIRSGEMA